MSTLSISPTFSAPRVARPTHTPVRLTRRGRVVVVIAALALLLLDPDGLLRLAVEGLAAANLIVGVLNLVPGLPLDGGRLLRAAVWKATSDVHRGTIVNAACVLGALKDDAGKLTLNMKHRPEKVRVSPLYAHLFRQM